MEKSFFVVVPYDPVAIPGAGKKGLLGAFGGKKAAATGGESSEIKQTHLEQLNRRVDEVVNNLRQIGLRAIALEDPELVELYFNQYNPSAIERRGEAVGKSGGGTASLEDVVAPSAVEVRPNNIKIGDKLSKTLFIFNYPRYLSSGWFSPIINFPDLIDISIFIHPTSTGIALRNLRKKVAQIESQINTNQEKGLVRSPLLETALHDVEALRGALQRSEEKLFDVGIYMTIYADTEKELNKLASDMTNTLDNKLVNTREAAFEHLKGFKSTLPIMEDGLQIHSPLIFVDRS